jgi:hypothetical protein
MSLVSRALCQGPHALDSREQRLPLLPSQRLAQQFAKQSHVIAQSLVRISRRGCYRHFPTMYPWNPCFPWLV